MKLALTFKKGGEKVDQKIFLAMTFACVFFLSHFHMKNKG